MTAEIITIGDELLIGQTIDTNSAWIGNKLSLLGMRTTKIISIQDDEKEIVTQLNASVLNADLVVVTGGLGPTKDDITKQVLTQFFSGKLVMNTIVLKGLEAYFSSRNRPMLEVNKNQAMIPDCCEVLLNKNGTAPGMWFEKNNTIVVALPGVPYEMKALMDEQVFPRLKSQKALTGIYHRTIQTVGIAESFLAEKIALWETKVRNENFGLAYLPSPGIVKLRLTSYKGVEDKVKINTYFSELTAIIPEYYFGEEKDTLSSVVGALLKAQHKTVGTVESCTAGSLASEIVKTHGASAYFEGSVLAYSYGLKEKLVNVNPETLNTVGAVSKDCVEQMAIGGKEKLGVDYCIATSGIAGPEGGTPEKPVGTVWIALAHENGIYSKKLQLSNMRDINIELSCKAALNMLRMKLLNQLK